MTPSDFEGVRFGPVPVHVDQPRIAAFVRATGDDAERWHDEAPPGYAAAVLFTIAPSLLFDPGLAEWTRLLIHGDQHFTWHGPLACGSYDITGAVDRVRLRQGIAFVTFSATLTAQSDIVLESRSTFLMGTDVPPSGPARIEPDVDEEARNEREPGRWLRSASRRRLVHYAAATGDFNPIHWDHDRARAAGLGGIVCHGLLTAAWVTQVGCGERAGPAPLAEGRYRFRNPLHPAEQATLTWQTAEDSAVTVELTGEAGTVVTATLTPRT